jgi:hypothetical protein
MTSVEASGTAVVEAILPSRVSPMMGLVPFDSVPFVVSSNI